MADGFGYNAFSKTNSNVVDSSDSLFSFIIDKNKAYSSGARVRFSDTETPLTKYFEGTVFSYNFTTGVMIISDVNVKVGAGSSNSWNVNIAGEKGANGQNAVNGTNGINGTNGAAGAAGADGKGYDAASTSSINLLTGAGTGGSWNMSAGKAYLVGTRVRFYHVASGEYFEGTLTAYNISTGDFTIASVDVKSGVSTHNSWNVSVAGVKGTNGSNGSNGTNGLDGKDFSGSTTTDSINILSGSATTLSGIATTLGKGWSVGNRVRFAYTTTPNLEYFEGIVSAYNPTNGAMSLIGIDLKVGTSNHALWNISLTGEPGTKSRYVAKTANYTVDLSDGTVDCTTGTFNITLPTAVGHTNSFNVKNSGSGFITILTTAAQTVDTSLSGEIILSPGDCLRVQSTNTNYIIL